MGFSTNPVDPCVFNKMVDGVQLTILLYVDDLLVTCELKGPIMKFVADLKSVFDEDVKFSLGSDVSYLGMHLRVEQGQIIVSMKAYIDALMEEYEVVGSAASPAKNDLFDIDRSSPLLSEKERQVFHTKVAKALYVAKHERLDAMLAVAFLTTRVTVATEQDQEKLDRLFKYFNANRDIPLIVKPNSLMKVEGYVDASFCTHQVDAKGHTGVVVSSKQKIVTKDSTESELVGVSDKHLTILQCADFMSGQGYGDSTAILLLNNTSTITLITTGGGKYRNKYLRVRRAVVKDQVDSGTLVVKYVPNGQMLTDVLSKSLQARHFRDLARCVLTGADTPQGYRI